MKIKVIFRFRRLTRFETEAHNQTEELLQEEINWIALNWTKELGNGLLVKAVVLGFTGKL